MRGWWCGVVEELRFVEVIEVKTTGARWSMRLKRKEGE
jgi:hypothetical protein